MQNPFHICRIQLLKKKNGVKKCLKIISIKGGGGVIRRQMEKSILNFHFDYLIISHTRGWVVAQRASSSAGVWALRRLGVAPPVAPSASASAVVLFSEHGADDSLGWKRRAACSVLYLCFAIHCGDNCGQRDGAVTIFDRWTLLLTSVNIHASI